MTPNLNSATNLLGRLTTTKGEMKRVLRPLRLWLQKTLHALRGGSWYRSSFMENQSCILSIQPPTPAAPGWVELPVLPATPYPEANHSESPPGLHRVVLKPLAKLQELDYV